MKKVIKLHYCGVCRKTYFNGKVLTAEELGYIIYISSKEQIPLNIIASVCKTCSN
jgi:hypothetical protein